MEMGFGLVGVKCWVGEREREMIYRDQGTRALEIEFPMLDMRYVQLNTIMFLSLSPIMDPALSFVSFCTVENPRYFWTSLAYWAISLQALFSCFSGTSRMRTPPSTSMLTCLWDTGSFGGSSSRFFFY